MSWGVWIVNAPAGLASFDELSAGHEFPPIDRTRIIDVARRHLGDVEPRGCSESESAFVAVPDDQASFLAINGPDVSGELSLPEEPDTNAGSVTLNIRSGSDRMVPTILRYVEELGARAFDMQTGDWLRTDDGASSFDEWCKYRASVLGEPDDG